MRNEVQLKIQTEQRLVHAQKLRVIADKLDGVALSLRRLSRNFRQRAATLGSADGQPPRRIRRRAGLSAVKPIRESHSTSHPGLKEQAAIARSAGGASLV